MSKKKPPAAGHQIGHRCPLSPADALPVMRDLFPAVQGNPDYGRGKKCNNPEAGAWSFWLKDGRRVDYCSTKAGLLVVAATVTTDPDRPPPMEDIP